MMAKLNILNEEVAQLSDDDAKETISELVTELQSLVKEQRSTTLTDDLARQVKTHGYAFYHKKLRFDGLTYLSLPLQITFSGLYDIGPVGNPYQSQNQKPWVNKLNFNLDSYQDWLRELMDKTIDLYDLVDNNQRSKCWGDPYGHNGYDCPMKIYVYYVPTIPTSSCHAIDSSGDVKYYHLKEHHVCNDESIILTNDDWRRQQLLVLPE